MSWGSSSDAAEKVSGGTVTSESPVELENITFAVTEFPADAQSVFNMSNHPMMSDDAKS